MHINHVLRRFREPSGLGRVIGGTLLSAVMLLQPFNSAWAVDRLSTGQSWFVLNETGIDTLGVQRLRITGPDAEAFTIEGYTGSPTGMTPSQDVFTPALVQKTPTTPLGVNLRFTPQHSGTHQANLEVTHDGSNASPFTYPLTGAGDWDVAAQASMPTLDFGERAVGLPAVTQDGFVRATGTHGWLRVTGMSLEGSSDFTLAQVGLANKGTTIWGTGANQEVLPAGATESTRTFTAADVSVGGLTDGAIRVRYTPTLRGPQTAVLTVYHDGPEGKTVMPVIAEGLRGTTVEVTQSRPYLATTPVTDFTRAGLGSATQTKTVYLKAGGEYGEVTYTGFEVVGSDDIRVRSVVQAYASNWNNGGYCNRDTIVNTISYSGEPDGGALSGTFSIKGSNVNGACSLAPGQHLALNLEYIPRTPGKQTATITVFHDGNDAGFTSFEISGEAFRDVSVEVTQNRPYLATAPVTGFARVALSSKTQLKTVYLKASGTYGEVTYTGFEVAGSNDIRVRSVVQAYASNWNNGGYCNKDTIVNTISYSGEPDGGALSGTFSIKGSNVNGKCSLAPGQHLTLNLEYIPRTPGTQSATITIYHDGNAQGFTEFEISGEAYSNVILTPSESPDTTVVAPSAMPDAYVGLPVTKSIYLRATGPNGAVTYQGADVSGTPGARITGAYSVVKGGNAVTGANLVAEPGTSAQFQLKGADVSTTGYTDLRVDVEFTPEQAGGGQLDLTFHHNAPRLTTQVSLATAAEDLAGRAFIQNKGSFRNWSDNTFAASCENYRRPATEDRVYAGLAGSGVYRINVAAGPLDVYCDMDSDGGGWTRVVRQSEAQPVTNWNGGVNGASYTLAAAQIPAHTQVGFGKDELATDVDFVDWTYATGDIPVPVLVTSPKTGYSYQVHREVNSFFNAHDPENTRAPNNEWKNTLTFDRTGGRFFTWAFSAMHPTAAYRGYAYKGVNVSSSVQPYAWTVWVR